MGTRSTTTFYDGEQPIAMLYRQFDGYPDGHGLELAGVLANHTMVNGISGDEDVIFNGVGDLAVRCISALKASHGGPSSAGGLYLMDPATAGDCGEDYLYRVTGVLGQEPHITCLTAGGATIIACFASEFPAAVQALEDAG